VSGIQSERLDVRFAVRGVDEEHELHPDLQPWVYNCPVLGRRLFHPLVNVVPLDIEGAVARANELYQWKKDCLVEYAAKRNWYGYVGAHEKTFRVYALQSMVLTHGVAGQELGEALACAWVHNEFVHRDLRMWREFWGRSDIESGVMDEEERSVLAALPSTVTVYRGTGHPRERGSLSWTLDQKTARGFATRFSNGGYLITGETKKKDIRALFTGESEIVSLRVRRMAVEPVSRPVEHAASEGGKVS
jgi:hypothetical protein